MLRGQLSQDVLLAAAHHQQLQLLMQLAQVRGSPLVPNKPTPSSHELTIAEVIRIVFPDLKHVWAQGVDQGPELCRAIECRCTSKKDSAFC